MAKQLESPVRINGEVLAKARIAAAYKGLSIGQYLSKALGPIVERDIEEGHKGLSQQAPDVARKAPVVEGKPKRGLKGK